MGAEELAAEMAFAGTPFDDGGARLSEGGDEGLDLGGFACAYAVDFGRRGLEGGSFS